MEKLFDMKKIIVLSSFFVGTPILIFLCIFYLSYLHLVKSGQVLGASTTGVAYAALPPADESYETQIIQEESQVEIVRQFLAKHKSPLEPYAPDMVIAAKRYDLDFRLLPAIAMQESNLCRRIPHESNNCWGWGIYGGKVTRFNNYPEAIETISKTLATKYRGRGLITPFEVGRMYNPSNTNNWAENVTHFMNEMK
jgi:hypothetical protein